MFFSIIIFVFTLLILVVLHELGHFLMAKKFGIKVEEFGFGIPPKIWGKKFGETLFSINALPIGGFVRLLGEDNAGAPVNSRDFRAKSVYKRIAVVIAGVVMNLLLAWIIFYVVLIYQDFKIIYPTLEPAAFVGFLQKDFPAEKAGINIGDRILSVNGKEIKTIDEARSLIKKEKGAPVNLTLSDVDGNNKKDLILTPKKTEKDYLIGVGFSPLAMKQYKTPTEKLFSGITYSWNLTKVTFGGFGKLLGDLTSGNFKTASDSVSGPVGMAKASNDILSSGKQALPFYLWFVGVISLTLSIFNVLPIPALDGGRLLFLVIEAITRKKVKESIEIRVHQIGFAILLSLALLVTYSDISKIIH